MNRSDLQKSMKRKNADPVSILAAAIGAAVPAMTIACLLDTARDVHAFRPSRKDRDSLIQYLLERDWPASKIAERVGCNEKTVRRVAATLRAHPEHGLNKGRNPDISGGPVSLPILSFSASGTPAEVHKEIQELLGI